jgi:hypothetical protein
MEGDASAILRNSISGYNTLIKKNENVRILSRSTAYGLMPVWQYIYQYKNQDYPFYVNGETGKIIGTAPLSKGKVWAYTLTLWGLLTVIFAAVKGILGLM